MTGRERYVTGAVVLCCLLAVPVWAQERAGEVLKQFERQEPMPRKRPATPVVKPEEREPAGQQRRNLPEDGTPIPVKRIVVEDGRGLLTAGEVAGVIAPLEGKQHTLAELLAVADRLTAILRAKGYITSYAYIPQQDISDGQLTIRIVAGMLGQVTVSGNQSYGAGFIGGHLETLRGSGVLTEFGLTRQLLILNEQPSLTVRAALKAGATPGATDIDLAVRDKRPFFGSLSYDNFGNSTISRDRFSAGLGVGNLAFDGDLLSLSGAMGLKRIDIDTLGYGRIEYGTPINYHGTRLGMYYANSLYQAGGSVAALELSGRTHVAGLFVTHPLLRRMSDSLTLKMAFDYKDISDYLLGSPNSRDRIRTLTTELTYDGADRLGGRNVLTAGWVTGLQPLLGGTGDRDTGTSRRHAGGGFSRFTLDALRDQNLGGGHRLMLRAGGQYSNDELFVAEQYSIGGVSSVRGYRPSFRSGDSGYTISAELHLALLQATRTAGDDGAFVPPAKTLSLYLIPFVDHGGVFRNNPQPGESHEAYLTSLGSGLRLSWGMLSGRLDWAVPKDGDWRMKNALTTVQVTAAF